MKTHYKTSNYVLVFAFSPLANGYLVIAVTSVEYSTLYLCESEESRKKNLYLRSI